MSPVTRRTLSGLELLLLITVEFALINHISSSEETCDEVNGQILCYYKASDYGESWGTAWQLCNSRNSTLPVIRNRNEQHVFERFLMAQMSGLAVWTSGRNHSYNVLKWLDGRTYTGRDSGYIRYIYGDSQQTLSRYICQYRGDTCNNFNDTSNVRNGCIRHSTDSRSWYEARNQCLMSGGDLAVLDNSDLHVYRIRYHGQWVGLRKYSWRWTITKTATEEDEIKWTNWSDDWNALNGECISIDASNGKWKAIGCSEQRRVVCQTGNRRESRSSVAPVEGKSQTASSVKWESQTVPLVERESQSSVSYSTFITVVIIGIVVIVILIFVVAFIVRKYVYRSVHAASSSETTAAAAADKSYQDLETIRKQAKQENTYTELALQPVYEEVSQRWK